MPVREPRPEKPQVWEITGVSADGSFRRMACPLTKRAPGLWTFMVTPDGVYDMPEPGSTFDLRLAWESGRARPRHLYHFPYAARKGVVTPEQAREIVTAA